MAAAIDQLSRKVDSIQSQKLTERNMSMAEPKSPSLRDFSHKELWYSWGEVFALITHKVRKCAEITGEEGRHYLSSLLADLEWIADISREIKVTDQQFKTLEKESAMAELPAHERAMMRIMEKQRECMTKDITHALKGLNLKSETSKQVSSAVRSQAKRHVCFKCGKDWAPSHQCQVVKEENSA